MTVALSPEQVAFLLGPAGRAAAPEVDPRDPRRALLELRRRFARAEAEALLELARARLAMRGRHSLADRLFVDSLAAAQASSEACARHRAGLLPAGVPVADLGASAGIDCLAIAARGPTLALEPEPARLLLLAANLELVGLRALLVRGRAPEAAPLAPFLHADPDRRVGDRRSHDPEAASPKLSELLALEPEGGLLVKLSPLAELEPLEARGSLDFVGLGGELKEIVLRTGALRGTGRRVVLADAGFALAGEPEPAPAPTRPGPFYFEAHPALLRSGLLGLLGRRQGLRLLAAGIGVLVGEEPLRHPLLRAFELVAVVRPEPGEIRRVMKTAGLERAEVGARGFPGSPEALERRLPRGKGPLARVLLTRLDEARVALVGRPLAD